MWLYRANINKMYSTSCLRELLTIISGEIALNLTKGECSLQTSLLSQGEYSAEYYIIFVLLPMFDLHNHCVPDDGTGLQ